MAQFMGSINDTVTRLGHKKGGLFTRTKGWNAGIKVFASYEETNEEDVFDVYADGDSSTRGGEDYIAKVTRLTVEFRHNGVAFATLNRSTGVLTINAKQGDKHIEFAEQEA